MQIRLDKLEKNNHGFSMNITPMFSLNFYIQTLGKKKRSTEQRLADEVAKAKERSIEQLSKCFELLIPKRLPLFGFAPFELICG